VRPVAVVVLDVLVDDGFEVASAEDEHPVQTFTPDGLDEAFGECVGPWSPDRSADGPNALGGEDLASRLRPARIARSEGRRAGRATRRQKTATSWRSTTTSMGGSESLDRFRRRTWTVRRKAR